MHDEAIMVLRRFYITENTNGEHRSHPARAALDTSPPRSAGPEVESEPGTEDGDPLTYSAGASRLTPWTRCRYHCDEAQARLQRDGVDSTPWRIDSPSGSVACRKRVHRWTESCVSISPLNSHDARLALDSLGTVGTGHSRPSSIRARSPAVRCIDSNLRLAKTSAPFRISTMRASRRHFSIIIRSARATR